MIYYIHADILGKKHLVITDLQRNDFYLFDDD